MTARRTILERRALPTTVRFWDSADNPVTPSTVYYRVDCLTNAQQVVGDTQVTAGSAVTINITSSNNAIIDATNTKELKELIVFGDYGTDDQTVHSYQYYVQNVQGVS